MKTSSSARLRHAVMLALWVAGSALMPRDASADAKLVPATVCQPLVQISQSSQENPDDVLERITNIRYSYNGRVLNQSATKRLGVVCPVLRDNLARRLDWIRVIYSDGFPDVGGPSEDRHEVLECEVRAANGLATVASDREPANTQASASNPNPFDVPGLAAGTGSGHFQFWGLDEVESNDNVDNPLSVYNVSHYTLICLIPPRFGNEFSWIAGIMISEP